MGESSAVGAPLVTGTVVIGAGVPAFAGGAVQVTLEEVSQADGGATTVARATIPGVRHAPPAPAAEARAPANRAGTRVPFVLRRARDAPAIDPRGHYTVRVWVDRDGDGAEAPDDLYSDQSYPVLTRGCGNTVIIVLGPA